MSGMDWMGVPASASGFVGGMVGFLGVETVREYAQRILGKKAGMVMEKGSDE
ncbi:Phage holin family (Lysis protein S) [compost metagenome]